ncbi:MAG: type II toxin-antitoxin system HicB family antitoxin [Mediterranea sp.]|jgi:hypothetical protein|nr:type II toxin-antitoxin system HicB family antitoxin [Mediterranea sp.]
MNKVQAIISGGKDLYGIWIKDSLIYSAGETLEKLKENLREAISLHIDAGGEIPDVMRGEYEIDYVFEISGLLRYYSQFLTYSAIGRLCDINHKQLWNYANGHRRASSKTAEKIAAGLHKFGDDLSHVRISF